METLKDKESRIEELIREGSTRRAVQGLYELIVSYAEHKDFAKAEALRDRLYHIDPLAILEIAQSGEILEQKKHQSLDREHMVLWSELYSEMTLEEANAFAYSLTPREFQPDSPMFQEGDTDRNLYFLDKGLIRLSFRKGNRDVYIATIGPGDAVGAETFFARSRERTFTATPLSSVKANELHASVLEKWKNQANSLPSVLYDFCFRNNPISKYFQEQWLDRRNRNRVRLRGTLAARALDSQGNPVSRPFKGVVQDFSSGGVAFNNTFKGDAAARSFLGGRIALMSRLQTKSAQDQLKKVGRVVAVEPRPFSEFTFHVRFDRPVPQDLVDTLGREVGSSQSPELKLEV